MYPHTHFLFALFLGIVANYMGLMSMSFAFSCAFLAVFIDVDHIVEHAFKCKSKPFSFRSMWNNCTHFHRYKERSFIHHKEGMILMTLLTGGLLLVSIPLGLVVGIAYSSHMLLDHLKTKRMVSKRFMGFYLVETYNAFVLDISLVVMILLML
ncbi:MAG: hypothetical protein ACLFP2_03650 [Candidatus Woesearchaeota archaeon]